MLKQLDIKIANIILYLITYFLTLFYFITKKFHNNILLRKIT